MTYLDNSATSKINDEVLYQVEKDLFKGVNKNELKNYTDKIKKLLNTDLDVVITSGSTESNNYAIKGMCEKSNKREIITTNLEHSSVNESLKYLESKGYIIKYIPLKDTMIDLKELEKMINENTALITVTYVNSEVGIINNINEIGKIAKKYKIPFHTDLTQGVGKIKINLENVDLASMSSHKFHGPKGIGILLKRSKIELKPLIYGERCYNLGLLNGMIKALENSYLNLDSNYEKVTDLRNYLKEKLKDIPEIKIIESKNNLPHIFNISVLGYKPETFLHYLEMSNIYISTKSACSNGDYSKAVYELTKDMERALTSVRLSLSEEITKEELDKVIDLIKERKHGK